MQCKSNNSSNLKIKSKFNFTNEDDLTLTLPDDCQRIIETEEFSNKISIFVGFWTSQDCINETTALFVFGDNDAHKGVGGQAIIRNRKNAIGIPTKKFPNNNITSFYTDATYDDNCQKIYTAIVKLVRASINYNAIIFPENGFGTGLAKLPEKAPKTLAYLEKMIEDVFGIEYEDIRKNGLQVCVNMPDMKN